MNRIDKPCIAIVDYGLGNIFSIKNVCNRVGIDSKITHSRHEILASDAVILPGVGAFGDAMKTLHDLKLVDVLRQAAFSAKPFLGICLGMQLLMSESYEFGSNKGLGIIDGTVEHLDKPIDSRGLQLKVPQVGWNKIANPQHEKKTWNHTILEGIDDGDFMYFIHSYYVQPKDEKIALSITQYGNIQFCSSIQYKNILACQFHPERSGPSGIKIYENFFNLVKEGEINE